MPGTAPSHVGLNSPYFFSLCLTSANPPFGGSSTISKTQKKEVISTCQGIKNNGILDYVCGWYFKTADLMSENSRIECAFVSTNSICQGEQVAPLWGSLFGRGLHINFAHQTFQWKNEAKDNAGVYCVIIGFSFVERKEKSEASCISVGKTEGFEPSRSRSSYSKGCRREKGEMPEPQN